MQFEGKECEVGSQYHHGKLVAELPMHVPGVRVGRMWDPTGRAFVAEVLECVLCVCCLFWSSCLAVAFMNLRKRL